MIKKEKDKRNLKKKRKEGRKIGEVNLKRTSRIKKKNKEDKFYSNRDF